MERSDFKFDVTEEEWNEWLEYKRRVSVRSVRFDPKDSVDFYPWLKHRRMIMEQGPLPKRLL